MRNIGTIIPKDPLSPSKGDAHSWVSPDVCQTVLVTAKTYSLNSLKMT